MIRFDIDHDNLRLGMVRAKGLVVGASPEDLVAEIRQYESRLRANAALVCEQTRATIRSVLRQGGYKPSGRGKPASEFLQKMALEEGIPLINVAVDSSNFASLISGYPISIFDADKLGNDVSLRFGRPDEKYVFNSSGHEMSVEGLPVICRGDQPVGNAVKDSMDCKVSERTRHVLAVIYGSRESSTTTMLRTAERLGDLLKKFARAEQVTLATAPD